MMKWPFNDADLIMSELGGPAIGMLAAHWESGMEFTAWVLEPKLPSKETGDLRWLNEDCYIAEIFDPNTGKLVYQGKLTFELKVSGYVNVRYPDEVSREQWLKWAEDHCPMRVTTCK